LLITAPTELAGAETPMLRSPPGDARAFAPDDAVVLDLSTIPADRHERFALLLDGVEVTGFARLDGDTLVLELPTDLTPGEHDLQVFEADPATDGWIDHGYLGFAVVSTGGAMQRRVGVQTELTYRAFDNGFDVLPDVDRLEGRGAVELEGRWTGERTKLDFHAPLFYDSERSSGALGKTWLLGDYALDAAAGPVSVRVGHHTPQPSSLILEGFHRRGISAVLDSPLGVELSGFLFRSDPIVGFRESFGISDEARRLLGTSLRTRPVAFGIGEISGEATWYRATGDEGGSAVATRDRRATERNAAYDLVTHVALFDRRVELRGEWSRSRFDFDGGGGEGPVKDTAWTGLAVLTPFRDLVVLGQPLDLRLSWEEREVGTFFRALGNPGAPTDLRTRYAGLAFYFAGLDLQLHHSRARDNRDDNQRQGIHRADSWSVDASYSPHWLAEAEPGSRAGWLGLPVVRAGWSRERLKPLANEPGTFRFPDPSSTDILEFPAIPALNDTTRVFYVALGSQWEHASLDLSGTELRFDDATHLQPDTRSRSTAVDLALHPHPRASLRATLQRESSRDRGPDFGQKRYLAGLDLNVSLVPNRIDGAVRVDWQKTTTSDGIVDERVTNFTFYGNWHTLEASGRRPGITFSVLGAYRDAIDESARGNDRDAFQIYLRWTLHWSSRGRLEER